MTSVVNENSLLKNKIEMLREKNERFGLSLDYYGAFYNDTNLIVKMGVQKIDALTKRLLKSNEEKSLRRTRSHDDDKDDDDDDDTPSYGTVVRRRKYKERKMGDGLLDERKEGNSFSGKLIPCSSSSSFSNILVEDSIEFGPKVTSDNHKNTLDAFWDDDDNDDETIFYSDYDKHSYGMDVRVEKVTENVEKFI